MDATIPRDAWKLLPMEAVSRLGALYLKHVGKGDLDVARLRGEIRHQKRLAEKGIVKVTHGLLTELRSELREVGMLMNEIARLSKLAQAG